jgi:lambda repressor-like predicted transcriptional regulator
MIVKTRNSTYEIEGRKIRRLETKDSTRDTGITDDWKKFQALIGPRLGCTMYIIWPTKGEFTKSTTTSTVMDIEDDEPELGWVL